MPHPHPHPHPLPPRPADEMAELPAGRVFHGGPVWEAWRPRGTPSSGSLPPSPRAAVEPWPPLFGHKRLRSRATRHSLRGEAEGGRQNARYVRGGYVVWTWISTCRGEARRGEARRDETRRDETPIFTICRRRTTHVTARYDPATPALRGGLYWTRAQDSAPLDPLASGLLVSPARPHDGHRRRERIRRGSGVRERCALRERSSHGRHRENERQ